jgi:glycosyltransferase involved in cell wall biosynthesis
MYTPCVTIITVTCNAIQSLEKTIISVLNQTYTNLEYIIIDGSSTDGTLDIIKKYENRLTKWISEPDNGIYDAMNKGVAMASGEWVNFMNAGDYFNENETIEQVFKNYDGKADVIYGDVLLSDGSVKKASNIEAMKLRLPFCHQAAFTKATIFKRIKFDTNYKIIADYVLYFNTYYKHMACFQYLKFVVAIFDTYGFSNRNLQLYFKEKIRFFRLNHSYLRMLLVFFLEKWKNLNGK